MRKGMFLLSLTYDKGTGISFTPHLREQFVK
ncbi:hypothetical protein EMIT07CA2_550121 [Brevibacillus sp. IT-7CA2]